MCIRDSISKDGTLGGPNFVMLDKMNHAVDCNIIASGGVASIMDIATLLDLNIYGAICGKALYSGTSVSYTHLDVYKRQTPTLSSARMWKTAVMRFFPAGAMTIF